jgi:hypothetical protein
VGRDRREGAERLNGRRTTGDRGTAEASPQHGSDDFFREVNERILELGERFGLSDQTLELICECGDATCTERVSIPCTEYEHVREAVDRRVVIAGHEHTAGVVTRGGGYVVVSD